MVDETEKELKKSEKDVRKTINWAAAEFGFLDKLDKDIDYAIREKRLEGEEKDIEKAIHVLRYVGRSERKSERNIRRVFDDLAELYEKIPSAQLKDHLRKVYQEMAIPDRELLKNASMFVGNLKDKLTHALVLIQVEEKKRSEGLNKTIKEEFEEIKNAVDKLEDWEKALIIGLKHAEQLVEGLKKLELEKGLKAEEGIVVTGFRIDGYNEPPDIRIAIEMVGTVGGKVFKLGEYQVASTGMPGDIVLRGEPPSEGDVGKLITMLKEWEEDEEKFSAELEEQLGLTEEMAKETIIKIFDILAKDYKKELIVLTESIQ